MNRLVRNGVLRLGSFAEALDDANLIDSAPDCLRWVPRPIRYLRLKEWEAVQIGTPRFFLIVALFDAKFASMAQAKIYDKKTGTKYLIEHMVPPWSFRNPRSLQNSSSRFKKSGVEIRFENQWENGYVTVHLHLRETEDNPNVDAVFRLSAEGVEPMIRSIPFSGGRSMYSHKAMMPVEGALRIGGVQSNLTPEDTFGFIDHHKGYYGRRMRWDWVTGGGATDKGRVGFNLTRNDSVDREKFNENAFWLDGKLHTLPAVNFIRRNEGEPHWRIFDRSGQVDLTFHIEMEGNTDLDLGVIESRYQGPFGRFEGTLTGDDGTTVEFEDVFGMGEKFFLKA
jgi:hypothetical protein